MIEWLETDGLGGYAMGAADGIRTRRYHGLLVAAARPPAQRMVLVAGVEAWAGDEALSSHRYGGDVIHPDGVKRLRAFRADPWPRWDYVLDDGAQLVHELVIVPGASRVVLRWRQLSGAPRVLRVRALLAGRDHHATHHENGGFGFEPALDGTRATWRPYPGVPAIVADAPGATYRHAPDWFRRFWLAEEAARGLDCEEDLASPGEWTWDLGAGPALLGFACDGAALDGIAGAFGAEQARRRTFASPAHRAADAYLVARGDGRTVIAGYPWFTDWGRDTFISLRGFIAAGRLEAARQIVGAWAETISQGMVPNRFLDDGEHAEYNAVDASLWFVVAADLVGGHEGAIDAIVSGYATGTRHRIRADVDGLLACGEPGVQLTWMDAKVDGRVITPRTGKPVEVQALWANALAIAGRRDARWQALLARARDAFTARFWNDERGCLFDVVDVDHLAGACDPAIRPNQLFAVGGLPVALVYGARARSIVAVCEQHLWTPAGPRSLSPDDPAYVPHYGGPPSSRDAAYHQGPVWPWLAGPFIEAWVRAHGQTPAARATARTRFLDPFLAHHGGPHIAELAQPTPPHAPTGCPFQAWSLAEALRLQYQALRDHAA